MPVVVVAVVVVVFVADINRLYVGVVFVVAAAADGVVCLLVELTNIWLLFNQTSFQVGLALELKTTCKYPFVFVLQLL